MLRPPSGVQNLDLRTWLAGCALANPKLIGECEGEAAVKKALVVADEMLSALKNRSPSQESLRAPTETELKDREELIQNQVRARSNDSKVTIPDMPKRAQQTDQSEIRKTFHTVTEELKRASQANIPAVKHAGFYSCILTE